MGATLIATAAVDVFAVEAFERISTDFVSVASPFDGPQIVFFLLRRGFAVN